LICQETAANHDHHACGKFSTTLTRPQGFGFSLAIVSRPGKKKNFSVLSVPQAKRVVNFKSSSSQFRIEGVAQGVAD
jgi:hypothetical protein